MMFSEALPQEPPGSNISSFSFYLIQKAWEVPVQTSREVSSRSSFADSTWGEGDSFHSQGMSRQEVEP